MDFGRILVGLIILVFFGWIFSLLMNIFVGIVNAIAFFFAKLLRRVFGIRGTWRQGGAIAELLIVLGKFGTGAFFWISLIWSVLFSPRGAFIAEWAALFAFFSLFVIWMPAVFLVGLFESFDD